MATSNLVTTANPTAFSPTMTRRSFAGLMAAGAALGLGIRLAAAETVQTPMEGATDIAENTADLIVVGAGAAGFTAALKAAQGGASVIMLEANSFVGGTTLMSGGHYKYLNEHYLSLLPERTEESDEELRGYLDLDPATFGDFAGALETAQSQITEYLASDSTLEFDSVEYWLVKHYEGVQGVDRDGNAAIVDYDVLAPAYYNQGEVYEWLTETCGIAYSDPNKFSRTAAGPISAEPEGRGAGLIASFEALAAQESGIRIDTSTQAIALVVEEGRVCGVVASTEAGEVTYTANKGVLLACGGYGSNPQMVAEQNVFTGIDETVPSCEGVFCDGTGIRIAAEQGAAVRGTNFVQFFSYPSAMMTSVMQMGKLSRAGKMTVDMDALRFTDDSTRMYSEMTLEANKVACNLRNGRYFIVGDATAVESLGDDFTYFNELGIIAVADTLEELAEGAGLDAATFVSTVESYNACCETGEDPDFGRALTAQDKVVEAPFTLVEVQMYALNTMGGVLIDPAGHVIDENGDPIEGLYAAGEVTGNFDGACRRHGDNFAQVFWYGYLCGQTIAAE